MLGIVFDTYENGGVFFVTPPLLLGIVFDTLEIGGVFFKGIVPSLVLGIVFDTRENRRRERTIAS